MGQCCSCCVQAQEYRAQQDDVEMGATSVSSVPPSPGRMRASPEEHLAAQRGAAKYDDTWRPDKRSSLFNLPDLQGEVEWARVYDIARSQRPDVDPRSILLFPDTPQAQNIRQGLLGDCPFVTSVASLSAHPDVLQAAFAGNDPHLNAAGVYSIRLFRDGQPISIVVDDRVPCIKGKRPLTPAFASSRARHPKQKGLVEFWPLILEKAYAKFYGSYQAIHSGNIAETMHDLTGNAVEGYNLLKLPRMAGGVQNTKLAPESQAVLRRLTAALERGCTITAGMPHHSAAHSELQNGLIAGHAYSILDVFSLQYTDAPPRAPNSALKTTEKQERIWLMKLYNPWGTRDSGIYRGEFGLHSAFWENHPELHGHPQVQWEGLQEGEFFMPVAEVFCCFELLNVCYLDQKEVVTRFSGAFTASSAGGSRSFTSFRQNDVYLLEVDDDDHEHARLRFMLQSKDQRGRVKPGSISYPPVGFCVLKVDPSDRLAAPTSLVAPQRDVTFDMTFWNRREVAAEVLLPTAAEQPARYLLIPSTYYPGVHSDYSLRVMSSEGNVNVSRLSWPAACKETVQGKWRHVGDEEYEVTVSDEVEVLGGVTVCVFLCQEAEGQKGVAPSADPPGEQTSVANVRGRYEVSLRVRQQRAAGRTRRISFKGAATGPPKVAPYSKATEVADMFTIEPGCTHTVLPCIRKYDRENIPFELTFLSTAPLTIKPKKT